MNELLKNKPPLDLDQVFNALAETETWLYDAVRQAEKSRDESIQALNNLCMARGCVGQLKLMVGKELNRLNPANKRDA